MLILGVNCLYHESSACLIADGRLIAAAEEERFNRRKHGKQVRADNPDELPRNAIDFCLSVARAKPGDIDHVAVAGDPVVMQRVWETYSPSPWSDRADHATFLSRLPAVEAAFADAGFDASFHWIAHHEAHAASALHYSGFQTAAVLVVDALGDDAYSTLAASAQGGRLHPIHRVAYPSSLGYLWELISVYLGFSVYDAAKVMGLAAYGNASRFMNAFDRLAWPTADGGFATNDPVLRVSEIRYESSSAYLDGLVEFLKHPPRQPNDPIEPVYQDVAAALQALTNRLMLHMTRVLFEVVGEPQLCLAGGVALNCVSNRYAFENSPFRELFVQPAANDAGLALGAASSVWRDKLGGGALSAMRHAYWGPRFNEQTVRSALEREGLSYEAPKDIAEAVAGLLAEGKVVAHFDGAMEIGPRALGNRSILADPRDAAMRERINQIIKHREGFRPLAPSILSERAAEWFEIAKPTPASDFMLMAYPARRRAIGLVPAVLHHDNSARIQTVNADEAPRFAAILRHFEHLTGVPMVLNTSYNDQTPIVCTPEDALEVFLDAPIDALVIGPYLVRASER